MSILHANLGESVVFLPLVGGRLQVGLQTGVVIHAQHFSTVCRSVRTILHLLGPYTDASGWEGLAVSRSALFDVGSRDGT